MKKFQVESSAGVVLGIFEAETKELAIKTLNALANEPESDRNDNLSCLEIKRYECDRDKLTRYQTGDRQYIEAVSADDARNQYAAWLTECGIDHSDDDINVRLVDWQV